MDNKQQPVFSEFRNNVRQRILKDMLQSVRTKGWKLLILDKRASKILSAACRMFDLMEEGVSVVEDIEKRRQPFPQLDAIYFVTPTLENINRIKEDFDPSNLRYAHAHIFFTSQLPNDLFSNLSSASHVVKKIKTLKESNVEYLAVEDHVFHLDMPDTFRIAFKQPTVDRDLDAELKAMAVGLATVCLSLGEFPLIRSSSPLTARFAALFIAELSKYQNLPDFPAKTERGAATLIVLDRTVDTVAPLLHEFTYQAMVEDLLHDRIKNGQYQLKYVDNTGKSKTKDVLIDENDTLWTNIRHFHISTTLEFLQKRIQEFQKTNKAASLLQANQAGEDVSIKQLGEAIRAMPTFQETLTKYSLHQNLTKKCYSRFSKRNLKNYGLLEQDLANGEDAEGNSPQNLLGRLTSLMNDTSVPSKYSEDQRVDKLRLLCLYAASQGSVDSSVRALISQTGINQATVEKALKNIVSLGTGVQGIKKSKEKQKGKSTTFIISRYVPKVKEIVEELLEDGLSTTAFPYVGDAPGEGGKKEVKSLKKAQPAWAKKEKQETVLSGPRAIVFVIGGVTFSEIRAMGELMEAQHREIIIGSNILLRPSDFVDNLKVLERN
eukprot:TRINITY_DN3623_c0_g1_i1.p1 TRINITY_DN3623_c0_g1~~TRINITY_DN3623_c0_g1_i1.p1  ORF type:complete len:605 (-),score=165.82 TRINITY_DN3623_c0_g1_i1:264-2078(-)